MNVLIVDDEEGLRSGLNKILTLEGCAVFEAADRAAALDAIRGNDIHLVLLDLKLEKEDGYDILVEIKKREPLISVIIITGYGDVESAVSCMRSGAINYITKPVNHDLLLSVIRKEEEARLCRIENLSLRETLRRENFGAIIESKHPLIRKNDEIIEKIKDRPVPVLILGETGTGKEITAKKIHYSGQSREQPFIGVNCAALNDNLLESELFGHEKGAFTGAHARKLGRFELAQGGTLFLDEIGDTSLSLQSKLLRVLQERNFERVGGTHSIAAHCRIIAATNRDIHAHIAVGSFRNDLFFRLSVITLTLPPLRERRDDIPGFARLFIEEANRDYNKRVKRFSRDAMEALLEYSWPGNIRQLKNVITNAVLLAEGEEIADLDLPGARPVEEREKPQDDGLKGMVNQEKSRLERDMIRKALEKNNGNISRTARELFISRKTLYEKIHQYGI